jgi:hypothetical protein
MKTCAKCRLSKSHDQFHRNKSRADGRSAYCKDCARSYYSQWSSKSPETKLRHIEWKRKNKLEARKRLVEYFKTHPCVDCGTLDVRVLVFDHVLGNKVTGVGTLISRGNTWKVIQAEIDKCEVRCHNCHIIVTGERGGWWFSNLVA